VPRLTSYPLQTGFFTATAVFFKLSFQEIELDRLVGWPTANKCD